MTIQYRHIGDLRVHPEYQELLARNRLGDFDALLRTPGRNHLRKRGLAGWRERIALTLNCPTGRKQFFLKRYSHPPLVQQLSRILSGYHSTSETECHWLREVERLRIGVPVAVAFGSRRSGPMEVQSLLLTAGLPGESLEKWLPAQGSNLDRPTKLQLSRKLAELASRLHSAGLVHRDLYLSHIFVEWDGPNCCKLHVLDLQRMIQPRWRARRWVVKDLAALNYSTPAAVASRADRLRWLMYYLGTKQRARAHGSLIAAIVRKTERIARHSAKHGLG